MNKAEHRESSRYRLCGLLLAVALALCVATAAAQGPITLSEHPQLFLDDDVIATTANIQRVLNPPRKHPDNPLPFVPEYPWEMARMDPGCVIYDAARDVFRMWYTVLMDKQRYADNFGYVGYAESEDGIHWRKPLFDIHEFEGRRPTNIVFKGPSRPNGECLFPSVIHTPEDAERPYKMLFTHRRSPDNQNHYGLHTATSQRWHPLDRAGADLRRQMRQPAEPRLVGTPRQILRLLPRPG